MSIERQSMQDGPTQHLIGESVHRARAEFEAAIKRNPADATAMANLAHILIRTCEFEEAILLCQKAIGLKSHHYVAQNNLGVAYAGLGLLDKARDAFENAINASPGYAQPCLNLAQLYHQQEKWLE